MRLTVARRVAGEAKCTATYVKLLEDLSRHGHLASGVPGKPSSRILAAGFLDYRMIRMSLDMPLPGDAWHAELAAAQLCDALRDGLGADPRMLSGRLAVLVDLAGDGEQAAASLRGSGYTVTMNNADIIS